LKDIQNTFKLPRPLECGKPILEGSHSKSRPYNYTVTVAAASAEATAVIVIIVKK